MTKHHQLLAAIVIGAALIAGGCSKPQDETAKKLEETQKQLEEAKKQLEAANLPVPGAQTPAPAQGSTPAPGAASRPGAAGQPATGSGKQAGAPAAPTAPAPPAPPPVRTLAAGTKIAVRTVGAVSTKTSQPGSTFEATLAEPLEVDGYLVAAKGAAVEGVVTNADPGGRVKGVATISVALRSIVLQDGNRLPIKTGSVGREAKTSKGKDAMKVGIASGIGAAIGAIAGGGKGAAIGAGAGAAGGTGVVMATRGEPATIPAESLLTFTLSAPVEVKVGKK